MAADPEVLGYTRILVPGYVVGEFLGAGRFSVVLKGEPVKEKGGNTDESSADSAEEEPADSRLLPAGFTQFVVPGDGNCFFHATAHQLCTAGVLDSNDEPFTHELLRALVVSLVDQDPRLRALMSDTEHADLGRVNGWVDHGAIAALANVLNVNVVVYGGCYEEVTFNPNGVGEAASGRPILRIIFRGNHYNSVVSDQPPATTLGKRKQDKEYELRARKKKEPLPQQQRHVVKHDSFPVAIKIFKEEHRKKCGHERKILDSLKALDNVPSVITQVDVRGKTALVISPAGHPVLPEKRGVHTNKTDFAHLVAVLRYAHSLKICHRDVKPQNIFKDDNGRVFLNDWSSAATTGSRVPWEGTPFFYPKHEAMHRPTAEDDLVALVRTVYILSTHDDPRFPARFAWEGSTMTRMEGNLLFRRALECARALDYDGLMKIFNQL